MIRMTRIVYAFRNKRWPKPTEGLDLFTPIVSKDDSSSESSDEEEDVNVSAWQGMEADPTWSGSDAEEAAGTAGDGVTEHVQSRPLSRAAKLGPRNYNVDNDDVDIEGDCGDDVGDDGRDFAIEKTQGLKMTFKKTSTATAPSGNRATPPLKVEGEGGERGERESLNPHLNYLLLFFLLLLYQKASVQQRR